jgi:hypothetical protein
VLELDEAEMLEEGRHVHHEATAIALAPVPPADRVRVGAGPGFEGAVLGALVLVGADELHPVAVALEHGEDVV